MKSRALRSLFSIFVVLLGICGVVQGQDVESEQFYEMRIFPVSARTAKNRLLLSQEQLIDLVTNNFDAFLKMKTLFIKNKILSDKTSKEASSSSKDI